MHCQRFLPRAAGGLPARAGASSQAGPATNNHGRDHNPKNRCAASSPIAGGPLQEVVPAAVLDALPAGALVVDARGVVHYRNGFALRYLPSGGALDQVFEGAMFAGAFGGWVEEIAAVHADGPARRFEFMTSTEHRATRRAYAVELAKLGEGRTIVLVHLGQMWTDEHTEHRDVSRRLASLGKIAARVAHELNNPLDGILRYINLALRLAGETPEPRLKTYLSESRTGLLRMIGIIGDLLEYSRAKVETFDAAGISDVIEQAIRSNAARADENGVVVAVDCHTADMPAVRGNRLYQVCCNLIRNAIDAMPEGGRLCITSAVVGESVVIRVVDTGPGLPDPPEKVFEPFYTTKKPGQGTGLGLAICKEFVNEMGGSITAERGTSCGAVFTLRIALGACVAAKANGRTGFEAT